jgi:uncharacterized protein YjbJ (UPF0337 family)
MTRLREKAQGHTKQVIGQMVGDDRLVVEGQQQVRDAEGEQAGRHSDHGIVKDEKADEQPRDKKRAQTADTTGANNSVSMEKTRDVK